jgi:hypothetical protein
VYVTGSGSVNISGGGGVEPILETAEGFSFLLFLFNATQKEKKIFRISKYIAIIMKQI